MVRIRLVDGEMDSMERWCSSKAPWRARTPIVIGWMLELMIKLSRCDFMYEETSLWFQSSDNMKKLQVILLIFKSGRIYPL